MAEEIKILLIEKPSISITTFHWITSFYHCLDRIFPIFVFLKLTHQLTSLLPATAARPEAKTHYASFT
jgi:hypothetical protein